MEIQEATTDDMVIGKIGVYKLDVWKFIFLSILTFTFYDIWWIYKTWNLFKTKEKLDINPAMRALFSIFFLIPLFDKILMDSKRLGYSKKYLSVPLLLGIIIFNLLGNLPNPYFFITFFSIGFFIPPLVALNYLFDSDNDFEVKEQATFNRNQIFLIIFGCIFWILTLYGLFI